eukprot:m.297504 g.297504  ORF g.297504 m.297504 type:complete len:107 (+) comp20082_c0_seq2:1332-1652(+)
MSGCGMSTASSIEPIAIAAVLTKLPALLVVTVVVCGRANAWYRDLFVLSSGATALLMAQSVAGVTETPDTGHMPLRRTAGVAAIGILSIVVWWAGLVAARILVVHD